MSASYSAGPIGLAVMPCRNRLALTSGEFKARTISLPSLSTIAFGVCERTYTPSLAVSLEVARASAARSGGLSAVAATAAMALETASSEWAAAHAVCSGGMALAQYVRMAEATRVREVADMETVRTGAVRVEAARVGETEVEV